LFFPVWLAALMGIDIQEYNLNQTMTFLGEALSLIAEIIARRQVEKKRNESKNRLESERTSKKCKPDAENVAGCRRWVAIRLVFLPLSGQQRIAICV
jgi:hypothetical protein